MIKQEKLKVLRAAMTLLRKTIIKNGYEVRCCDFSLKELPGYSTKDAINLLKIKRGGNHD